MSDGNKTKPDPNYMDRERNNANPTIIDNLFNAHRAGGAGAPSHAGTMPDPGIVTGKGGAETTMSNDPLGGFLVSYSRREEGEYWPLHYGNNFIGCAPGSKIALSEMTVSTDHANISVWTDDDNACLYVQILDRGSKNGTFLNGKKILQIGQGMQLKNGDRIGIGEYLFYLVIVDKFILDLNPNPAFKEKTSVPDYSNQFFQTGLGL